MSDRNRPRKHIERAEVVLVSARCGTVQGIAAQVGVSHPMGWRCQQRFAETGVDGLLRDRTRKPGKPPISAETVGRVVALTCGNPEGEVTQWTGRAMAPAVGLCPGTATALCGGPRPGGGTGPGDCPTYTEPGSNMGTGMRRVRRWAAILLPVVLLVFQLCSGHEEREHVDDSSTWPPVPGEVLRLRADSPGLAAGAESAGRRPLVAVLLTRGKRTQELDAACLLDPGAMGRNGGELTSRDQAAAGLWEVDCNGHRTTKTRDEVGIPESDAAVREAEAAVLDGADCGGTARLELSEAALKALVDALAGEDSTKQVPPPWAGLNNHAVLPEQPQ